MIALVFCINQYKELLTFAGVKYWTEESYVERREKELKDGRCADINLKKSDRFFSIEDLECETQTVKSIPYDISKIKDNAAESWDFFKVIVLYVPMLLLVCLISLWYAFRWIIRGFRK